MNDTRSKGKIKRILNLMNFNYNLMLWNNFNLNHNKYCCGSIKINVLAASNCCSNKVISAMFLLFEYSTAI